MELTRETLLNAYPSTPQDVKDDIALTLRTIQAQARPAPKRYARRLSFAGMLAMILIMAMLAAAIAAGAHFGVFDFMGRIFGGSGVLPQAGELVQTNLGMLDLPHTIITAEEAIYDGGSLQVVYSIEAKNLSRKPTEEDLYNPLAGHENPDSELSQALAADVICWYSGFDWFFINGEEIVMTNGSFGDAAFDEESGKIYCYMNMQLASSGIVPLGDFQVALPVAGELRDKKLLTFTMKENVTEGPRLTLQTAQEIITVQSTFATPVRIYVNLRVEAKDGVGAEQAAYLFQDWQDAMLVDAAGNAVSQLAEVFPGDVVDGKGTDYHYTFLPVDLAEVYLAPTILDDEGNWVPDMSRALRVR